MNHPKAEESVNSYLPVVISDKVACVVRFLKGNEKFVITNATKPALELLLKASWNAPLPNVKRLPLRRL